MLDFSCWANNSGADIQTFDTPSTVTNVQWMTWRKPRGCTMAYIFCLGGGGGGGGACGGAASTARGGGAGGSCSTQTVTLIPLFLLPDVLYIQAGAGGSGGAGAGGGGVVGGIGVTSFVSITPGTGQMANVVVASGGNNGGAGGGAGTTISSGTGGGLGVISSLAFMNYGSLGFNTFLSSMNGSAGGSQAGAIGGYVSFSTAGLTCTGGAGGAGTTSADFGGGGFNITTGIFMSDSRPASPAAGSFNGSAGPQLLKPFFGYGGCGGSASNAGVGGNGGNGAFGCGGGGGGGGTTGGRGGNGGTGIVYIISF